MLHYEFMHLFGLVLDLLEKQEAISCFSLFCWSWILWLSSHYLWDLFCFTGCLLTWVSSYLLQHCYIVTMLVLFKLLITMSPMREPSILRWTVTLVVSIFVSTLFFFVLSPPFIKTANLLNHASPCSIFSTVAIQAPNAPHSTCELEGAVKILNFHIALCVSLSMVGHPYLIVLYIHFLSFK